MERKMNTFEKAVLYAVLILISAITLLPLVYTIAGAFKSNSEILAHPENLLPSKPTFENFKIAWNSNQFNVKQMTINSVIYTLVVVATTIFTATLGGYVFARGDFYGKNVIFAIFTALMFVSLGSITIYPTFDVLNLFGLSQSLWGLMVYKFFGIGIVNIYLARSHILSLPKAVEEAAQIDGLGFMGIYSKIVFPMLKPIIATIGIMSTIFTISRPEQRTLIVGVMALKNSEGAASSWNLMLAGATISIVPVLIAYSIGNKFFVAGLTSGAVKG